MERPHRPTLSALTPDPRVPSGSARLRILAPTTADCKTRASSTAHPCNQEAADVSIVPPPPIRNGGTSEWEQGASRPVVSDVVERLLLQPLRQGRFGQASAMAWTLSRRWLTLAPGTLPSQGIAALNKVAAMLYLSGELDQARKLWERILTLCRRQPDQALADQAAAIHGIGAVLHKEGDLATAQSMLRSAWDLRRTVLGENHPETASTINRLAMVHWQTQDLVEAEALLRQTIEIRGAVLGEWHPDYALSLNNLGAVLLSRGDAVGAETLLRQAVEIRRAVLGDKHPDCANSLSNLAMVYQAKGEMGRALALHHEALEIRRMSLGEKHPLYVNNLNSLIELLLSRGDLAGALPLIDQTLGRSRRSLAEPPPSLDASPVPDGVAMLGWSRLTGNLNVEPPAPAPDVTPPLAVHDPSPMSTMIEELSGQLASLCQQYADLTQPLYDTASALKEPGAPPSDDVLQRLTTCRDGFHALRDQIHGEADQVGLAVVNGETANLSALGQFLTRIDSEQQRFGELRRQALALLDQVVGLKHIEQEPFALLQGCQGQAHSLRDQVAAASAVDLDRLASPLTKPDHPFAQLINLVAGQHTLDDDAWATAYETVAQEFGRSLAVAASRARLAPSQGTNPS